ncbi:hypothetical protein [Bacillus cereus]
MTKVDIRPAVSGGMIRVSGHVKDQKTRKTENSLFQLVNGKIIQLLDGD